MAELPSTPRPSMNEKLVDLYNSISTRNSSGIRSHLANKNINSYSWGFSQRAGSPQYFSTNAINGAPAGYPNDWAQRNFIPNQPLGVTQFTANGLGYAKNTLKIDTTGYGNSSR